MKISNFLVVASMLLSGLALALDNKEEIDIIVAGTAGGMTNASVQVVNAQLKKLGYKTNIIISGNCKSGGVLYNKEQNKPTLLATSLDYIVFGDVTGDCTSVNRNDFVAMTSQSHHLICGPAGSTFEKFVAEKNEVIMSSETGTTAKAVIGVLSKHANVKIKHIMYESSGAAVKGLLSGEVNYAATWPDKIIDHVQSGKVSCFATAADHEVFGAKQITKLLPGSNLDGAISYVVLLGKNIQNVQELKASMNQVYATPEWAAFMQRSAAVIPVINNDNQVKLFNDTYEKNVNLFKKNRLN